MIRILLASLAIGLAALTAEAQVEAILRPGTGPSFRPGSGIGAPIGRLRQDIVTAYVGHAYRGFSRMDVMQALGYQAQGRIVESLVVKMQGPGGRSQVALLEDGSASASGQRLPDYLKDVYFSVQYPRVDAQLELNMNGPVYIESITATVSDPTPPPPSPTILVSGWVQQSFRGGVTLDVGSYVDLYRYHGMRVVRVTVRASSARGHGQADLVIDGRSQYQPQNIGTWTSDVTLDALTYDRLGIDIRDLGVSLRGDISVESITVELEP